MTGQTYQNAFRKIEMNAGAKECIRNKIEQESEEREKGHISKAMCWVPAAAVLILLILCVPQTRRLVMAAGDYVIGLFSGVDGTQAVEADVIPAFTVPKDVSLWKPPVLTLIFGEKTYQADLWNYNWKYSDTGRKKHTSHNSSAHPQGRKMTHVYQDGKSRTLQLEFSLTPRMITVRSWEMEYANEYNAYHQNKQSEWKVRSEEKDGKTLYTAEIPSDRPLVVEVCGEWKYGTSSYCFEIVPKETETDDVCTWMDIKLPDDYCIDWYSDFTGYFGGSLILPQAYTDRKLQEYGPKPEWVASGVISRLPAESVGIGFDDVQVPDPETLDHFPVSERTIQEYIECFPLTEDNWYVLMFSEEHVLFQESQIRGMEERGIKPEEEELQSRYWVFWFVKEDADMYYMLSLAANRFSREEARQVAEAVRIR